MNTRWTMILDKYTIDLKERIMELYDDVEFEIKTYLCYSDLVIFIKVIDPGIIMNESTIAEVAESLFYLSKDTNEIMLQCMKNHIGTVVSLIDVMEIVLPHFEDISYDIEETGPPEAASSPGIGYSKLKAKVDMRVGLLSIK